MSASKFKHPDAEPLPPELARHLVPMADSMPLFSMRSMGRFEIRLRHWAGRDWRWAMWLCDFLERKWWARPPREERT